jgi:hypothetical protein
LEIGTSEALAAAEVAAPATKGHTRQNEATAPKDTNCKSKERLALPFFWKFFVATTTDKTKSATGTIIKTALNNIILPPKDYILSLLFFSDNKSDFNSLPG